jgi:hypothetical protein
MISRQSDLVYYIMANQNGPPPGQIYAEAGLYMQYHAKMNGWKKLKGNLQIHSEITKQPKYRKVRRLLPAHGLGDSALSLAYPLRL